MIGDTYVPGIGPLGAKIAIVGEAPSFEEVAQLTPFVGPSGRLLDSLLKDAGLSRQNCWITNLLKYQIPPNLPEGKKIPFQVRAKQVGIDVNQSIEELRKELQQIKPNLVIALGGSALWGLTGKSAIQKFRGSILQGMGFKVIGTYHPAHILHQDGDVKGYWNKQVVLFDLKRCREQSQFSEIILPNRSLNICRSSAQLYDFIQRHKNFMRPAADIEAKNCIPACIGLSFNKYEGLTIPLFNFEELGFYIHPSDLASMWLLLAEVLFNNDIVGQNFGYDRDKIKRLGLIIRKLASDTMLKAFGINPELPKNLAFNTSIYTEEPYYKDEGMYEGSLQDLFIGCARDACVTKEIDLAMDADIDELGIRDYYENFLLKLHDLYGWIENNGLRTDNQRRNELLRKYVEWDEKIRYNLYNIAGEYVNTASPKQVSKLLYEKWNLPERKGTGEEILTQLLPRVKNPIYKKGIELILEDRRVKKTISTYLCAPEDFDGRMRTSYFICLETGRSSTNQQSPPVRPTIDSYDEQGKKKKQDLGASFQVFTKHGDIGADARSMYVADEGEIFLQADSSQAEARVIFLLAEDYQALKDIDEHDYHALTASWFFGGTESDYSKKVLGYESPIRFAGKTLRHAGHLGATKRRAAIEINTQARKYKIDYQITEQSAGKALEIFHKKQPKIKGVFHAEVIRCLERNRRLIAPVPHGIKANIGGTRIFYERWGDELFRQAFSYLPQRTVSENTKAAGLRIRARANWIRIMVESHDALLVSVSIRRKYEAAGILKEEFERPINFEACSLKRGELIIPCEIEEGYNYAELSKFKYLKENVA